MPWAKTKYEQAQVLFLCLLPQHIDLVLFLPGILSTAEGRCVHRTSDQGRQVHEVKDVN